MSEQQFIGRGEVFTKKILEIFYPDSTVVGQYPIRQLIPVAQAMQVFCNFNSEVMKHKFDIAVIRPQEKFSLIVEVNYHHKEKAAANWRRIFEPFILDLHLIPVTIDDHKCDYLFKPKKTLDDYIGSIQDIVNALKLAGVKKIN